MRAPAGMGKWKLLNESSVYSGLSQMQCRARTDDAAADDGYAKVRCVAGWIQCIGEMSAASKVSRALKIPCLKRQSETKNEKVLLHEVQIGGALESQ